jgi:hypothetical protein
MIMEMKRSDYREVLESWNRHCTGVSTLTDSQIEFLDKEFGLKFRTWYWLNRTMKESKGMLFYTGSLDGGSSEFYGFNLKGEYTDKLSVEYSGEEIKACLTEVLDMFKREFYKRGYDEHKYECLLTPGKFKNGKLKYFTLVDEGSGVWVNYKKRGKMVFSEGNWARFQ